MACKRKPDSAGSKFGLPMAADLRAEGNAWRGDLSVVVTTVWREKVLNPAKAGFRNRIFYIVVLNKRAKL